ncbi:uncharacterized protein si:ch211-1a19.3 isoform X1 [Alosa alosa]|uniref:uncharacterized protein si:ch211-1a19.3 isoform X1 n=1 Tax=Alosa alosa TaxID=278164 RepID=UPI0020150441|nr:uncharacterized protein si:ch211-1a19.3 isoform X1 [Alosa alosa]
MRRFCAVPNCGKIHSKKSCHRLPFNDPERLKLWLEFLGLDVSTPVENLQKADHRVSAVCILLNFAGGRKNTPKKLFRLRNTAVPTLPPGTTELEELGVLLSRNITVLETQIEMHEAIEANLTTLLSLQKDEIEGLQSNLTEKLHELDSCEARRDAAVSLQTAAEKTAAACRASKMYLQSQLVKCQAEIQKEESSQQQQPPGSGASSLGSHRWHLAWVLLTTILLALTS